MAQKRLRIGLFSHDFYPPQGGQGRNFSEAFVRLRGLDPRLEFLAFSPDQSRLEGHTSVLAFTSRWPLAQLFFSFFLNFLISRIVAAHKLDLVVLNGGPGGILLWRSLKVPLIYWVNHTYHQQSEHVKGQFWKRLFMPLERRGYRAAHRLVAISSTTAQDLADHYGIERESVAIIPVGVDLGRFKPLGMAKLPQALLFLGRLQPRKGLDFLLEAMTLVREQVPEVVLYVGGSGKLRGALEAYVRRQGLERQVHFLGYVPEDDLPLWYNRCQVQIVPSVFEGLGITALEGLACGTPLVATRAAGLTDIVKEGYNGCLVPYGDRAELCRCIVELLLDQDKYRSFSENGLKSIKDDFAWERVLEQYRAFYLKLADETPLNKK